MTTREQGRTLRATSGRAQREGGGGERGNQTSGKGMKKPGT